MLDILINEGILILGEIDYLNKMLDVNSLTEKADLDYIEHQKNILIDYERLVKQNNSISEDLQKELKKTIKNLAFDKNHSNTSEKLSRHIDDTLEIHRILNDILIKNYKY